MSYDFGRWSGEDDGEYGGGWMVVGGRWWVDGGGWMVVIEMVVIEMVVGGWWWVDGGGRDGEVWW